MKRWAWLIAATGVLATGAHAAPVSLHPVALYNGQTLATVIHEDTKTSALAAGMLAHDFKTLTGRDAKVSTQLADCAAVCVVIGTIDSTLVAQIARDAGLDLGALKGQWERYERVAVTAGGKTYLLIAGSDRRGAVYGVVDLSRALGVSAWEWWADVTPRHADSLSVDGAPLVSETPSVQYRGLFLNDEDWGLEPWSAKTYDPKSGTIGPKTYARIFELMWRLKANTIWPAMHDVTSPFYGDLDNPKLADDYAIVVGTSHAEPLLRNNTREWDEKTMGRFNFLTNRDRMVPYWQKRIDESKTYESLYTIGLRGTGDGPMEGATTPEDRKNVLDAVIPVERDLLSKSLGKPANRIPQAFTVYKEVEEAYNAGLKLPDDVTLIWCDDNYGYLTRLSSPDEQKRLGGAGIYYHISYWGRPHDYLWLATTKPGLIREEMGRAWAENARKEWILNVGDIKPGEYLTQYFLDLAFDNKTFDETPQQHLSAWMTQQFGPDQAPEIAAIMMRYYDLAWERKPEFMGWDQTEPITPTKTSPYVQSDGEEAQARLKAYADLVARAEKVAAALPADRRDAFFELVLYPMRGAANLNTRILKLDLASLYGHQGRASANVYADQARAAQARIVADTAAYNSLLDGKWNHMMDMAPRRLPVFETPAWPQWSDGDKTGCSVSYPGQFNGDETALTFRKGVPETRTVTLYGWQSKPLAWTATSANPALKTAAAGGTLNHDGAWEERLDIVYDGSDGKGGIALTCGDKKVAIKTAILAPVIDNLPGEQNRIISIPAARATANPAWETVTQLGSQGAVLRSKLDLHGEVPPLVYDFVSSANVGGTMKIVLLPTHPLTPAQSMKLGVSLDGGPVEMLDFATVGRSDEWRENVLSNTAVRVLPLKPLTPGQHQLRVIALDPGLMLDHIEIDLDGATAHYGATPAT